MRQLECQKVFSRGYVASALAGAITSGLFGLLAVLNHTAAKLEVVEPEPLPETVALPRPETPKISEPPESKHSPVPIALPKLPESTPQKSPPLLELPRDVLIPKPKVGIDGTDIWLPRMPFDPHEVDMQPAAVQRIAPVYPYLEKKNRISGEVIVTFVVDEFGAVRDPVIESSSNRNFAAAALEAIHNWRFQPGMKNDRPVATRMRQTFTFSARD